MKKFTTHAMDNFFFRHVNDKKNSLFHNNRRKINGFEC